MNMIKLRENEEAVSPVIGVILMVAITVILAAVIAAFVFGMGSGVETQKQIAINAKQIAGSELQVTVQGGTDLSSLKYLRVNIDDTSYYAYVEGSERKFSSTATAPSSSYASISVGTTFTTTGNALKDGPHHIVIVGAFNDGKEQMLLETTL